MRIMALTGLFLTALGLSLSQDIGAADVKWTLIVPELGGATYVKDRTKCLECHEEYMIPFDNTIHGRISKQNREALDCENCHGPMSKHLEAPNKRPAILLSLKTASAGDKNRVCEQCHEGGMHLWWRGSMHQRTGLSCMDCHYLLERKSDRALLIYENPTDVCTRCHMDRKAQMYKYSHMPVREGKMNCISCHNPHGSGAPNMLKAGSVNDTCYGCHAEKRGPFIWEHAPVRENCTNCHDPHGSNNPKMLTAKGPFLCTNCHQYGGHVNVPRYNRASALIGQGCVNCHSRIHGSNHPSGAKLTR